MAGKIFINYRREDARAEAARLHDRLAAAFGAANVFMDVDNLRAGERFDLKLQKALAETDVFLAVIGARWSELLAARVESGEHDYVREEIAAALARKISIIPVLADRAPMPRAADLPGDIRDLVLHQKHDVVHESFGRDAAALIQAIKAARRARSKPLAVPWTPIMALALAAAGASAHFLLPARMPDPAPSAIAEPPKRKQDPKPAPAPSTPPRQVAEAEPQPAKPPADALKTDASEAARAAWADIEDKTDPRLFEAFRQQFGKSNPFYDALAERRIAELTPAPAVSPEPPGNVLTISKKPTPDPSLNSGPFHIQVGAFPDAAQAEDRLNLVKQALGPALLQKHPAFVMPVPLPTGATMYRLRLSRFLDETQAKAVCAKLRQSGLECWDIRAD
ncbi:MAG: TIR domain-containing protein [Rhodomicrobium sp.]